MSSSTSNKAYFAKFLIGNTCRELPEDQQYTKVCLDDIEREFKHDYHIYLDVVEGDPRIIARVEVDMGSSFLSKRHYVQNRPKKIPIVQEEEDDGLHDNHILNSIENPSFIWRCFESRQRCYGSNPGIVRFRIVGISGKDLKVKYDGSEVVEGFFCDQPGTGPSQVQPIPLPKSVGFSVESMPLQTSRLGGDDLGDMTIVNHHQPLLVTPLLYGEDGVESVRSQALEFDAPSQSAGVTVSVVIDHNLEAAKKLALNYIKYEEAIDEVLQVLRKKSDAGLPDPFVMVGEGLGAASNRDLVTGTTNKEKHDTLIACDSFTALINKLCPENATILEAYKLSLSEIDGKLRARFFVPDIQISDAKVLEHLVRFLVHFVYNSARLRQPKSLKPDRTLEEQLGFLFEHVIRDRVLEDTLAMRGDTLKDSVLRDADTTVMNLSECMDGLSIVAGPVSGNVPLEVFDDSLLEPDIQGVTRKRPRGVPPHDFITVPSTTLNLDALFGYDLNHDRVFTSTKLSKILKKLHTTVGNQRAQRMDSLKRYFEARSTELTKYFERDQSQSEASGATGSILGIELAMEEEATCNDITMYLRGGKQVSRLRASADVARSDDLVLADVPSDALESVCIKLGIPVGVSHLDSYINGLEPSTFAHEVEDGAGCCFVLAQNFVSKTLR